MDRRGPRGRPASPGRTAFLPSQTPLDLRQPISRLLSDTWAVDRSAVGGGQERGHAHAQTHVDAGLRTGRCRRPGGHVIAGQGHLPATARAPHRNCSNPAEHRPGLIAIMHACFRRTMVGITTFPRSGVVRRPVIRHYRGKRDHPPGRRAQRKPNRTPHIQGSRDSMWHDRCPIPLSPEGDSPLGSS